MATTPALHQLAASLRGEFGPNERRSEAQIFPTGQGLVHDVLTVCRAREFVGWIMDGIGWIVL